MSIECHEEASANIFTLDGELDLLMSKDLTTALREAVESGHVNLIVDLGGVSFIDSSGLGALVGGLKQAKRAGGSLALAAMREQPRLIFEITRADELFESYETTAAALAAFAAAAAEPGRGA